MGRHTCLIATLLLSCLAVGNWQVQASDPEATTDFVVPPGVNASTLDGTFFTYTGLRDLPETEGNFVTPTNVNTGVFPALDGLGVSTALLQFPAGAVNPPHNHPRANELLYVLEGELFTGLVDTTNKLFTQTLKAGDLFVFPKGLVHYQLNYGLTPAKAFASFSSSNSGAVRLPNAIFKSTIPDDVLAQSFGVSNYVISQLKAATVT